MDDPVSGGSIKQFGPKMGSQLAQADPLMRRKELI
jgi:hypothetical protein